MAVSQITSGRGDCEARTNYFEIVDIEVAMEDMKGWACAGSRKVGMIGDGDAEAETTLPRG